MSFYFCDQTIESSNKYPLKTSITYRCSLFFCGLWFLTVAMWSRVVYLPRSWFSARIGATCAEMVSVASSHCGNKELFRPVALNRRVRGGQYRRGSSMIWVGFCNCQELSIPTSVLINYAYSLKIVPWNTSPYLVLTSSKTGMYFYLALILCCQVVMK